MEKYYDLMKATLILTLTWALYAFIINTGYENELMILLPLINTLFYSIYVYKLALFSLSNKK